MLHQCQATFNYFVTLFVAIRSNLWTINRDYFLCKLVAKQRIITKSKVSCLFVNPPKTVVRLYQLSPNVHVA